MFYHSGSEWTGVGCLGLLHNNLCRLFTVKSIFIQTNSSISNNSVKHEFILIVKIFLFQGIQFSQTVLIQTIQFSISIDFVYTQLNAKISIFQTIQ